MVLIQHVIPATPGAPERVECEAATESSASSPPKLLRSLAAVEARAATAKDKSHLRETYLVESGAHLRALKCLEANLGRTAQADARGSVYSHDVLEGYLRCRFMARAPRPPEAAARARRGARAGRPGRAADVLLARGRAPGRRPRVRGRGDRPIARAQVYDKTGKGQIDMADFSKLLGLLKDGRATGDLEKELTKLHVNDEGKIGYFEFIQWWCREDDSI